jgi:hypothetical protein
VTERTYWTRLTKTGWLKYVPRKQHAELRARLKEALKSDDPESAYLVLCQAGFDAEWIDGPESYCELLRFLARDSNGAFHPTRIKSEYVRVGRKASIKISFRHKGKSFSCVVPFVDDCVEPEFMDLVNQAMEAGGCEERFIEVPPKGQLVFLAVVPPHVFNKAVKAGLMPPAKTVE